MGLMESHCFRCNSSYTEPPALSRRDNKTYICSSCGNQESINDYLDFVRIPPQQIEREKMFHDKIGADFNVWKNWKLRQHEHKEFSSRGLQ